MKFFLLAVSLVLFYVVDAQKNKNVYNTKIDKAKKVDIKNSTVTILKADSVVIENPNSATKLYLKSNTFIKDTDNMYLCTYTLVPQDNRRTFDYNIIVEFNEKIHYPYKSIPYVGLSSYAGGQLSANEYVDTLKNTIFAKGVATSYGDSAAISIRVKTEKIPHVTIAGVVGKLP